MADAQTQAPDSSTDIASLAGGSGSPFDGLDYKKSIADLTDLKRKQVKEETDAMGKTDVESDRMLHNAEYFFRQEGVGPNNVPKAWDANKEHEKFEHNPIEGLGSVGGIFAVIASAFTKAPMENAINGMAGAINSIKAGDEAAYTRAYESYKENVKLALDRQKIQHEQYQDAVELMKTNMAAGQAKLHNLAVKYGDQQSLLLLDHGMDKELIEMMGARQKSTEQLREFQEKDMGREARMVAYNALKQPTPPGATEHQAQMIAAMNLNAWNKVNNIKPETNTAENEVTARIIAENPKDTGAELAKKLQEAGVRVGREPERDRIIQERVYYEEQAIRDREGREPTAQESAKIRQDAAAMGHGGGAGGSPMVQKQNDYVETAYKEIRDKYGREPTADEKQQVLKKSKEKFADRRIDQSIVNELTSNYPHMKEEDLGFIPLTQQPKLKGAFESADHLEAIAAYAKENPDAIGLIADSSRKMNLDSYQGLLQDPKDLPKLKTQTEKDSDAAIDSAAKANGLDLTVAAKAKVLQKMLTTQAFADAASAGSRGATIYLDKAFREIYDQASSPGAFFSILEKRYDDANREATTYRMPFDERAQYKDMPFWSDKAVGFVSNLGSPPEKKVAGAAQSLPESAQAQLEEGHVTVFKNGQRWTLRDGKPVKLGESAGPTPPVSR